MKKDVGTTKIQQFEESRWADLAARFKSGDYPPLYRNRILSRKEIQHEELFDLNDFFLVDCILRGL